MQMRRVSDKRLFGLPSSETELRDITKAWIAISVAFAVLLSGGKIDGEFVVLMVFAAITVGLGFLLHELAHKVVAQRYGCVAEFRAFNNMLIVMILLSFVGFIFAAPGAVMIAGPVGVRRNGLISAAGPATNIVLALVFLALTFSSADILAQLGSYGFFINGWLALFNLIPVWNFDGRKVLAWSKPVYASLVVVSAVLVFGRSWL